MQVFRHSNCFNIIIRCVQVVSKATAKINQTSMSAKKMRVVCGARKKVIDVYNGCNTMETIFEEFSLSRPFILQTWDHDLRRFVNIISKEDLVNKSELYVITFADSIDARDCLSVKLILPKLKSTADRRVQLGATESKSISIEVSYYAGYRMCLACCRRTD